MINQVNTRKYRSELREARARETRNRILEAARRLFTEHGYTGTSVAEIAESAGVSTQTVYNSVGSKGALLLALNDLVDREGKVAEIQREIACACDPRRVLALTASLRRQLMERAGDIVELLMEGAATEPEVAAAWAEGLARSRAGARRIARRLADLGALRPGICPDTAADTLYAILHHGVWVRLVRECGWSPEAVESWTADMLERALLGE
jgi:AcrR family transcriptional regulator